MIHISYILGVILISFLISLAIRWKEYSGHSFDGKIGIIFHSEVSLILWGGTLVYTIIIGSLWTLIWVLTHIFMYYGIRIGW